MCNVVCDSELVNSKKFSRLSEAPSVWLHALGLYRRAFALFSFRASRVCGLPVTPSLSKQCAQRAFCRYLQLFLALHQLPSFDNTQKTAGASLADVIGFVSLASRHHPGVLLKVIDDFKQSTKNSDSLLQQLLAGLYHIAIASIPTPKTVAQFFA